MIIKKNNKNNNNKETFHLYGLILDGKKKLIIFIGCHEVTMRGYGH